MRKYIKNKCTSLKLPEMKSEKGMEEKDKPSLEDAGCIHFPGADIRDDYLNGNKQSVI